MTNSSGINSSEDTAPKDPLSVFLCHSSGDKSEVRNLYQRLRVYGIAPWLDEESLLPGQDWSREIQKAVRASDLVIVCLSRGSITKAGYVQKEIKFALDIADEQPEGTIFIIPLRLEECDVPDRLTRWQWVDFYEAKGRERLIRALKVRAKDAGKNIVDPTPITGVEYQGEDIHAELWIHQTQIDEGQTIGIIAPGDRPVLLRLTHVMKDGSKLRLKGLGVNENGALYLHIRYI